jgi:pimeloyl-ACP methyl ester carboxylesterase
LDNVRLRLRDWPGYAGPLVHSPDRPATSSLIENIAASLAPRYRVLSLAPRGDAPYQVHATDLVEVLRQFGFRSPILIGERLGSLTSLIVAAWYPVCVGGLVLVDPLSTALPGDTIEARSLRDCPPEIARLRSAVRCPVLESHDARDIEAFVTATLP